MNLNTFTTTSHNTPTPAPVTDSWIDKLPPVIIHSVMYIRDSARYVAKSENIIIKT